MNRPTPKALRAALDSRRPSTSRNSSQSRFRSRGGWSLIEVIATLVLSAFLVTLLLPLIGSGLQGTRRPLLRMPATYSLQAAMDGWWHRYRTEFVGDLPGLSTAINDAAAANPPPPYTVLYNNWVTIDDDTGVETETPGVTTNDLRVTLGNPQGERLTAYFFPIP